jgi:hypothetical protein
MGYGDETATLGAAAGGIRCEMSLFLLSQTGGDVPLYGGIVFLAEVGECVAEELVRTGVFWFQRYGLI